MKTTLRTEFINEDRTVDTERAIEAGHDARTVAIKEFAAWLALTIKASLYRCEMPRL